MLSRFFLLIQVIVFTLLLGVQVIALAGPGFWERNGNIMDANKREHEMNKAQEEMVRGNDNQSGSSLGDSPFVIGILLGGLIAVCAWFIANQATTSLGKYKATLWICGAVLLSAAVLCIAIAYGKNSGSGMRSFVLFGLFFFSIPHALLIYFMRVARNSDAKKEQKISLKENPINLMKVNIKFDPDITPPVMSVEELGDKIKIMTVDEIALAIGKTRRSVKAMIGRRGLKCADFGTGISLPSEED